MSGGQPSAHGGSPHEALRFGRAHRLLVAVVVTGAVVIAGIGFAGSYAAVRELALQKGFGNFSYVFPIGIDAGICVLLALDLLLTWIRIPFPLLRQTAWLLTAATIAFNGAAAWPDPLGVGMHSVIPILFVVSVEAARHAVGRIADITADKHMEGVRLTRWLLSPLPTFLLWRRMKLWELRSYEQVIKLEQERLVYQARLRSRFGRAWRRKAPVESLMPLRLARYGVPLAETAPSGLAAAGIEPAVLPPAPRRQTELERVDAPTAAPPQVGPARPRDERNRGQEGGVAVAASHVEPPAQHPTDLLDAAHTGTPDVPQDGAVRSPAAPAERATPTHRTHASLEQSPLSGSPAGAALKAADRYYLAWRDYQQQHGHEPLGPALSEHLAARGELDRHGNPIKTKTLGRYLLEFRIYVVWAEHRTHTLDPDLEKVAHDLTQRGVTGQYNRPLQPSDLSRFAEPFEHRWHHLTPHESGASPVD
ncbi:DUF2637 domain-containing protein [Streptomyces fructofermentans]|uniref:DUF2637 domain-containing protein n=1 Tax=Streptomyces fructofermentans TaxID=152141 RepID=A0A918U5V8_9ACTN|nr:DUF2637 domain-containing protein [Streptomyces fructofermentans]GGX96590.1 hypothetical protein GCM10010515_73930 [Streptomyces fructofermentans]